MKKLYLLRHAKSDWKTPAKADFDRPLAARGERTAPRIGQEIKRLNITPDLVLCSTARRAQQTYALIADCLPTHQEVEHRDDLYMASAAQLQKVVRRLPDSTDSLLMIGHNPGMQALALHLASRASPAEPLNSLKQKYPTAALAVFELPIESWRQVDAGCGKLKLLVKPRDLDG